MYLWLTLKKDGEGFRLWALGFGTKKQKTENQGDNVESGPAEREGKRESEGGKAESVSSFILHPSSFLQATCHAGAIVLLVGFWFDGGLCELPTAATFWILLELGAVQPQENYLTASAAAKALVDRTQRTQRMTLKSRNNGVGFWRRIMCYLPPKSADKGNYFNDQDCKEFCFPIFALSAFSR
jgi:hypothetical protein